MKHPGDQSSTSAMVSVIVIAILAIGGLLLLLVGGAAWFYMARATRVAELELRRAEEARLVALHQERLAHEAAQRAAAAADARTEARLQTQTPAPSATNRKLLQIVLQINATGGILFDDRIWTYEELREYLTAEDGHREEQFHTVIAADPETKFSDVQRVLSLCEELGIPCEIRASQASPVP